MHESFCKIQIRKVHRNRMEQLVLIVPLYHIFDERSSSLIIDSSTSGERLVLSVSCSATRQISTSHPNRSTMAKNDFASALLVSSPEYLDSPTSLYKSDNFISIPFTS